MTIPRATTAALAIALAPVSPAEASEALLGEACSVCHTATDAGLSRIAEQRKSPEGWLMTIVRMRQFHGAEIDVGTQAELVAYLSDTQGLAPAEAAPFRYAPERDPSTIEGFEQDFAEMCARCHTGARAVLQRRTAEEWALLMEFHVGQFPTIEYQALGRDREWYAIARNQIAGYLAEKYPLDTAEWREWAAADWPEPNGDWIVLTELPGLGQAYGRLTVSGDAMPYTLSGEMRLADGSSATVSGQMNFYTGYEWRANIEVGDRAMRQVLAVSDDGARLSGRQFDRVQDSLGAALVGVRAGSDSAILGIVPEAARGREAVVQIVGTGLDEVSVEGAALDALAANDFGATAELASDAEGRVRLQAGESTGSFAFFEQPDRISIEPEFTIARIGGGGPDSPAPMPASFRAVAWWNGPDEEPGTEDDIRIGMIDADWSTGNLHEIAEAMRDAEFAGAIGTDGIFIPGPAGPNPERLFSANNVGELEITAEAMGLSATATLIVTVQRFIDPPLR